MSLMKIPSYKEHLIQSIIKICMEELHDISSLMSNSILKETKSKDIINVDIKSIIQEFSVKIPTLLKIIKQISKNDEYFTVQICNSIISSHNQTLSALRYKNGLFFRQCGLQKKVRYF